MSSREPGSPREGLRIVVFTANPELETGPFWPQVLRTPGLSALLVVRRTASRRPHDISRRFWRNLRKHGWLFAPYRVSLLLLTQVARIVKTPPRKTGESRVTVPVEEITGLDIHDEDILARIRAWKPDLGVSLGAPILRPPLFSIPRLGTLNVHLGKVPEFRGAPPGFWELWHGATEIGATIHWMDAGLDTGAVVEEATAPLYRHDTPRRVEARAAELAERLLATALRRIANGDARGVPQSPGGRTNRFPTIRQEFSLWRRLTWYRLRSRCEDPLAILKISFTTLWLAMYRPVRDLVRTLLGRHPVRIFTYHRVTNLCRDGMTVAPDVFHEQIAYLTKHHEVMDLDSALQKLSAGAVLRKPVAAITFDDGYRSVNTEARVSMTEFGVPGTCFVCTSTTGTDQRYPHDERSAVRDRLDVMNWSELKGLMQAGWTVGGHTASHRRMSSLADTEFDSEVREPVAILNRRLGVTRPAMAYPYGGKYDCTTEGVEAVKAAGYSTLLSDYGGENYPGDDPFTLKRIDLGGDHEPLMWKAAAHGLDLSGLKQRFHREERSSPGKGEVPAGPASSAPRKTLRVTQIVFDLDGGGMETLVAAMAARWHDSDVRMSVITLSGRIGRVGQLVRPLVEQFHVLRLTPGISMISPHGLMRALRQTQPDVVQLHTGAWLKGAYAARLASVPRVFYTEHGREHHDPMLDRLQDRLASHFTNRVIAVSERLGAYMVKSVGVRADRVVTIRNGVDTNVFTPHTGDGSLRAALGIPADSLVIGSVGRLEPVKAYSRLVAIYAALRRMDLGRPLALVIFGEGSDRTAIEAEVDRLEVRDGVRLPGWTDHAAEGYRMFDLFAMTSTSEGMSVSLMEAMACGICPLVTDVGSNAEVLGDALKTHVISDYDEGEFVRVAAELLSSSARRAAAGAAARQHAVVKHSLARMLGEYERLYRDEPMRSDPRLHSAGAPLPFD
jgi:glycosyltransferase involved in cell wall biosynthesis/folate-dependent phosphoribosylglycinamide formyltransferase PurN